MRTALLLLIAATISVATGCVPLTPLLVAQMAGSMAGELTVAAAGRTSDQPASEATPTEWQAAQHRCERATGHTCESSEATALRHAREDAMRRADVEQIRPPLVPDPSLPDHLDRASILAGIAPVIASVHACRDPRVTGQVLVAIKVEPAGVVTSVAVKASPDPDLGTCVAAMVEKATFATTGRGGSFVYPFVF